MHPSVSRGRLVVRPRFCGRSTGALRVALGSKGGAITGGDMGYTGDSMMILPIGGVGL